MGARLVSICGTGPYDAVRYEWGGHQTADATGLMPAALVELYSKQTAAKVPPVSSVVLVGTDEAHDYYRTAFAIPGAQLEDAFQGRFAFVRVEKGETEDGQRDIFENVVKWLKPEAKEERLLGFKESEPPQEIVLDITHGLRPQALIAGAATTFVFAEAIRTVNRTGARLVPIRILYGERRVDEDRPSSIWDLTQFVSATLWTLAIQAVRYGRADAAQVLSKQEARNPIGTRGRYPEQLGEALRDFADDLAFLRVHHLFKRSSHRLAELLKSDYRNDIARDVPALQPLLEELDRDVETIAANSVLGRDGLRAMVSLADLYGRIERFAEQAATLREAYLTLFARNHLSPSADDEPYIEPDTPGASTERRYIEDCIPVRHVERKLPRVERTYGADAGEDLLKRMETAKSIRNDMLHLGLRDQPAKNKSLRKVLRTLTVDLSQRVDEGKSERLVPPETQQVRGTLTIDLETLYADPAKLADLDQYRDAALAAAGDGNEVVLTGAAPVWLYLAIAHTLHGKARKLVYRSPVTGDVVIFDHDPF